MFAYVVHRYVSILFVLYDCRGIASIVDHDLLIGDISFYNRTLAFALREDDEARGTDLLWLIENLMAPWDVRYNPARTAVAIQKSADDPIANIIRRRAIMVLITTGIMTVVLCLALVLMVLLSIVYPNMRGKDDQAGIFAGSWDLA
jgi:hypothetical protein